MTLKERRIALLMELTSGKYKQIHGHLHTVGNCYCAEGIACLVYNQDKDTTPKVNMDMHHSMPSYVARYFLYNTSKYVKMSVLNDHEGMTFKGIAEMLRKAWNISKKEAYNGKL